MKRHCLLVPLWPMLLLICALTTTEALAQNLALNKPATASSTKTPNVPANAVDGSLFSNWRSLDVNPPNPEWLRVDLQAALAVSSVITRWNSSHFATAYQIQVSNDDANWTTVFSSLLRTHKRRSVWRYWATFYTITFAVAAPQLVYLFCSPCRLLPWPWLLFFNRNRGGCTAFSSGFCLLRSSFQAA